MTCSFCNVTKTEPLKCRNVIVGCTQVSPGIFTMCGMCGIGTCVELIKCAPAPVLYWNALYCADGTVLRTCWELSWDAVMRVLSIHVCHNCAGFAHPRIPNLQRITPDGDRAVHQQDYSGHVSAHHFHTSSFSQKKCTRGCFPNVWNGQGRFQCAVYTYDRKLELMDTME